MKQIGKIKFAFGLSVAILANNGTANAADFVLIDYPPGIVNFSIDARSQVYADKGLWRILRSDEKNTVYTGQHDSLKDHAVQILRNGRGELRGVVATQVPEKTFIAGASGENSWKELLKEGVRQVWSGLSVPRPIPHMTVASIEENQVASQTKCVEQVCYTVTPSFCQALLRQSSAKDYADLTEQTLACRKLDEAWDRALATPRVREELASAYKKNMKELNGSGLIAKMHSPAFGDVSHKFKRVSVGDPLRSTLLQVIIRSCAKLGASSKHFAIRSAATATTSSASGAGASAAE